MTLEAIGEAPVVYVASQRLMSHAVHGTWVDILVHHIAEVKDSPSSVGFTPKRDFAPVDERSFGPISCFALLSAESYVKIFFNDIPEVKPLTDRIADLCQRIIRVGQADELALQKLRSQE